MRFLINTVIHEFSNKYYNIWVFFGAAKYVRHIKYNKYEKVNTRFLLNTVMCEISNKYCNPLMSFLINTIIYEFSLVQQNMWGTSSTISMKK